MWKKKPTENIRKRNILVIDEVSMVKPKLLGQMELVCRPAKNCQTCLDLHKLFHLEICTNSLRSKISWMALSVISCMRKTSLTKFTLKNVHHQVSNGDHLPTAVNKLERGCVSNATLNALRTLSRPLNSETCLNLFVWNYEDIYNYESIPWEPS